MTTRKILPHLPLLAFLLVAVPACTTPEKQGPTQVSVVEQANPTSATPTSTATGVTPAPMAVSDEATPPLYVKVNGPATVASNTDIELDIEIVRSAPDGTPMLIAVVVPTGAQLVSGLAKESVVDTTSSSLHRILKIHVGASVPSTDVTVTVDASGAGSGVHATNAYRFGRAEPKLPQPTPVNGPSLSAKGVKLGKPIKAD